jgi:hypothetical protein
MQSGTQTTLIQEKMVWARRIISAIPVLFLLIDGMAKLIKPAPVVEVIVRLGYPESVIHGLGTLLLVYTVVYVVPRTSILGAILLTGYLGGATATHVRIGDPLFRLCFRALLACCSGEEGFLCDERLRALIPLRR